MKGFNSVTLGFVLFGVGLLTFFMLCIMMIVCYECIFPQLHHIEFKCPSRRSQHRPKRGQASKETSEQVRIGENVANSKFATIMKAARGVLFSKAMTITAKPAEETMV